MKTVKQKKRQKVLIAKLAVINDHGDEESAHCEGEDLLLTFLKQEGYKEVADAYAKASQHWWYA